MAKTAKKIPWLNWRNGRAYVYWYDEEIRQVKRLSLRTSDAGDAQARFAAFLVEGDAIMRPAGGGAITVQQALDDYLKEHVAGKCACPKRQEDAARHLTTFFGDKLLCEIDIPASRRYAYARRTGQVGGDRFGHRKVGSDATIRRELNVLITAANHAFKWRRIAADKMPSIELTPDSTLGPDTETCFFTKAEVRQLIDMAEGELRSFIELAYWTGARRRSIEDMERSQVRWDQKLIVLMKPGKKATKKRQPIVPLLPEMESTLRALWTASEGRERLFACGDFYRRFKDLCGALGFRERSHPHLLRHSRATHLLQDGVSIYAVARLLGDTVASIESVYGHHSAEVLAKEIGSITGRKVSDSVVSCRAGEALNP